MTDVSLTDDELEALKITADLANLVCGKIITKGPAYEQDINEFVSHLHVIQRMIGANAAARAHPYKFRLLGEEVPHRKPPLGGSHERMSQRPPDPSSRVDSRDAPMNPTADGRKVWL